MQIWPCPGGAPWWQELGLLCGTGKCSSEQTLPMCCHLEELITGSVVPLLTIRRELLKPFGKAWAASGWEDGWSPADAGGSGDGTPESSCAPTHVIGGRSGCAPVPSYLQPAVLPKQSGKRTLEIGLNIIKLGGGLSHLAIIKIPKKQTDSSTPLPWVTWELWKLHLAWMKCWSTLIFIFLMREVVLIPFIRAVAGSLICGYFEYWPACNCFILSSFRVLK